MSKITWVDEEGNELEEYISDELVEFLMKPAYKNCHVTVRILLQEEYPGCSTGRASIVLVYRFNNEECHPSE